MDGKEHSHAFLKNQPETACAVVAATRGGGEGSLSVMSSIRQMTFLKTTQSGFAGYLKDEYTLLPECDERCLASELSAEWTYTSGSGRPSTVDYAGVRAKVKEELLRGLFGPPQTGVFSASLQATVYDAACLALAAVPEVQSVAIDTPNLHYLPTSQLLPKLGEGTNKFENDVFVPTSEPSGTIHCTVSRDGGSSQRVPGDSKSKSLGVLGSLLGGK